MLYFQLSSCKCLNRMFLNIKHEVFFCVLTSVPLAASVFGVNLSCSFNVGNLLAFSLFQLNVDSPV